MITFENTSENAREILANMGKNIDVIAGIFDETMLELRGCDGTRFQENHFVWRYQFITGWQKKKKLHLMIWLEKILCHAKRMELLWRYAKG